MLTNLLGLLVLLALTFLFAWLASRAWRKGHGLVRWGGGILASLFTLVFVVLIVVFGRGLYLLYTPHSVLPFTADIANTPEQVARGEHLAASVCAPCHSLTGELPLSGGNNLAADTGLPLGDLYPPNLTPAGPVKDLSDADIWRIFRQGVFPNGRQALMPVTHLKNLSDADLQAVIAYVRSQSAVAYVNPPVNPSPLMVLFVGAGLFNVAITPVTGVVSAPPEGATTDYGAYIVSYNDCTECHGKNLDGHPTGPTPAGPNLRVVKGWTAEQFIQTIRTGVDPTGHQLQPPMPWKSYAKMDDVELTTVYLYLQSLPPLASQK